MPVQVTHNNDGHFYTIDVDIAKEGAEVFDLSTYFKARVADNHTGLRVRWFWQGQILNTVGKVPRVEGVVGQYSFKKGTNGTRDLVMSPDASAVAFDGDINDCEPGGYATYYFPGQMFPQEGLFKGTIGLVDDSGETAHYTSVDIWFKVYPQAGGAQMGRACDFYISELDKAIKEAEDDLAAAKKSMQKVVDDFTAKMNDLSNQITTQVNTDKAALAALETRIEQDNIVTKPQLDAFKQTIEEALTEHYNTLEDVQKANLKKGQTVTTLGAYAVGDGGAATYLITDTPSDVKLDNGLYAEKIYSGKDNYYDEIKETIKRINNTDVYFVDIPKTDSHGQPITPYIAQNGADRYYNAATKEGGYHDSPTGRDETPTEYARSEHTTLTVNGSASVMVANNTYVNGNIIGNGKILNTWQDQPASVVVPSNFVYVGIMKDRSLREFPFSTTAQQMLDAGVQNSWMSYWRLIRDGNLVDNSNSKGNEGHTKVKVLDPHLGLGIKEDGTLVIAACDGRTDVNSGLTSDDFAQAMKDWGCVNAWHMDGGGSTSVTLRGSKINRNIDDYGVTDRAIPYTFNIKKPGSDTGVAEAFSQAGKAQQEAIRQVMPAVHHLDTTTAKWFGQYSFKSDDELDQWLNDSLPDLINWIDYPAGGMTSGVIATQYQNSAPGKTVGVVNNADWLATFFVSGSHNWGYLTMTAHWGSGLRTVVRSFGEPLNPQWGNWTPKNYPVQITPTKIDNQFSICNVYRSGAHVSVDVQMTISGTSGKWIVMVEGLPHPVAASQPFGLTSDDNNVARMIIDQVGRIEVRGDAGTYHGHFVYLANNY